MYYIIAAVAALIGFILAVSFYTFYICFYAKKDRTEDPYAIMHGRQYQSVKDNIIACTRIMDKAPCEWVYTNSFDDLKLAGRYYHTADGAPLIILFHGYRSISLRDCAGGYILSKKLGIALPWLRLSIIGSLSYETVAAETTIKQLENGVDKCAYIIVGKGIFF